MRHPCISVSDAKRVVESRRAGTPIDSEPLTTQRGSGTPIDLGFVERLKAVLNRKRKKFPTKLKGKADSAGSAFEAQLAELVHSMVPYDPVLVADPAFWRWLAVVHFGDLIEWRYGNKPSGCALNNYGIGATSENFLYRQWLRADLAHDSADADPYRLARRGDLDFWRSHLFRQAYANSRTLARALLRYQYPDPGTSARLKTVAIRELVKRLKRLRANLYFEFMDESQCTGIIENEVQKLDLRT